jgi:hypothetical protein
MADSNRSIQLIFSVNSIPSLNLYVIICKGHRTVPLAVHQVATQAMIIHQMGGEFEVEFHIKDQGAACDC